MNNPVKPPVKPPVIHLARREEANMEELSNLSRTQEGARAQVIPSVGMLLACWRRSPNGLWLCEGSPTC